MTPTLPDALAGPETDSSKRTRLQALTRPVVAIRDPAALTIFHYIAYLYVVLYVSRFIEFLPGFLRPILVFSVILIGGALMSGRILALLSTTGGRIMAGCLLWMSVCSLFSIWPGQSIQIMITMYKTFLSVMIIVAFTSSFRAAVGMVMSTAFGLGMSALFPLFSGGSMAGRSVVDAQDGGGTLSDPNFFCMFLIMGVPLLGYATWRMQKVGKLIPLGLSFLALGYAVLTSSRSGFLALAIAVVFLFFQVTGQQKVKILIGAGVAVGMLVVLAPSTTLLRLTTIFDIDSSRVKTEEEQLEAQRAAGSAEGRLHLLTQGIQMTLRNPIFGVGPDMFQDGEERLAEEQGIRSSRHVSHNTYVQASSETGFLGFGLFAALIFVAYRNLTKVRAWCRKNYHPMGREIYAITFAFQTTLLMLYVELFFLSLLFSPIVWILVGLAIALTEVARQELARNFDLPVGPAKQGPPLYVLKRPGVVLAKDLAGVGNIRGQGASKQFVGTRPGRGVPGDGPVPRPSGG